MKITNLLPEAGPYGSRNPDTMSATDYDRYQQDQMDQGKRDFKRSEHEAEWEREQEYTRQLQARDQGPWYLRIDGKILKSQGQPKVFDMKKGANNYALAIIKNKPELQGKIMLTKNSTDVAPTEAALGGSSSSGNVASSSGRMNPDTIVVQEHKKGVKAMKYTAKTRSPVAKAHQAIGSGSGEHKDKKKVATQVRGQKHKNKSTEVAESYFTRLEQGMAEGSLNEGKGLAGELANFLKSNGFKGPYRLGKLPKWSADLSEFDKNSLIMVQGNDVEYDEFVIDIGYGQLYWGAEGGMTKMTEKAIMNHVQEGVAEGLGKDIKRLATGKDVKSRAGQEIAKSQDASMKSDHKTSKKHFDRYDKLDKLANKGQGVAEGFNGEYDDEAGMAQSNLRTMARAVDGLLKTIKSNDNLPEWGQEKIAKAEMMLVSVWDYLLSQKEMGMDPKIGEGVAGPKKCWPNHRKVGTQPGTGKNKGKRVNDCEEIKESNWYEMRLAQLLESDLKK